VTLSSALIHAHAGQPRRLPGVATAFVSGPGHGVHAALTDHVTSASYDVGLS
jgi:phosphoketolase